MSSPVYLVRHGESEWNRLRLTQGQTMHPRLTTTGRRQGADAADLIAADLADTSSVRVISSDLLRAAETAEIIGARLSRGAPMEISFDNRLREHALGELEGTPYEASWAMADHPEWRDPHLRVGGGETAQEVHDRVACLLAEVSGPAVLVSHGDTIRAACAWLHGLPVTEGSRVHVANGAVLRVDTLRWLGDAQPPMAGSPRA